MQNFSRLFTLPVLLSLLIVGVAYACGAPFAHDPGTLLTVGALGLTAVPAVADAANELPWGRIRKDLPQFETVNGTGIATLKIQRQARSLMGITLKMGGTTFNESHLTLIRLKLGSKPIWTCTGAHLAKINAFKGYYVGNRQFLYIDFSARNSKSQGGEFVGGINLATLPQNSQLVLEVTITGATAPTLAAKGTWGQPQDNNIMQRMLQFNWSALGANRRIMGIDLGGARLRNLFCIYSGTDWMTTGVATAWATNTAGAGAMGAITVAAGTKVGTWKLLIVEPAANAGTFVLEDPDGNIISVKGAVAGAYSGGGIGFTLADATDYASGDGFDIVVSENNQGNLQRLEIIKDGDPIWDFYDEEARNLLKNYGFIPQTLMSAACLELDGWNDGTLATEGSLIEIAGTFAAVSDLTIYGEVLDIPTNPKN